MLDDIIGKFLNIKLKHIDKFNICGVAVVIVVRNNWNFDRRTFLGGIASTSAVAGMSGMSSAAESSKSTGLLELENGRLTLNVRNERGTAVSQDAVMKGVDENRLQRVAREALEGGPVTGKDAAALLAKGVEKINEAAKKGLVRFGRQNGQVVVTPTPKAVGEAPSTTQSDVSVQGCGITEYSGQTPGIFNPMFRHEFAMDDDDSAYVAHKLKEGVAVSGLMSAVFGALAGTVVGTAPALIASVICAIIAAVANIIADDINYKNEGCGTVLHIDHLPVYGTVPPIPELTFNYQVNSQ